MIKLNGQLLSNATSHKSIASKYTLIEFICSDQQQSQFSSLNSMSNAVFEMLSTLLIICKSTGYILKFEMNALSSMRFNWLMFLWKQNFHKFGMYSNAPLAIVSSLSLNNTTNLYFDKSYFANSSMSYPSKRHPFNLFNA